MTTADSKTGKGAAPTSEQELTAEIEHIREELGATVEALTAKTDIKARIRAAVNRLALPLRVGKAKAKLRSRASGAGATVGNAVPEPVQHAAQRAAVTAQQAAVTAQRAGATVGKTMPPPVQQAAQKAAVTARKRRGPLAVAAGAAALGSVAAVIARWRRR